MQQSFDGPTSCCHEQKRIARRRSNCDDDVVDHLGGRRCAGISAWRMLRRLVVAPPQKPTNRALMATTHPSGQTGCCHRAAAQARPTASTTPSTTWAACWTTRAAMAAAWACSAYSTPTGRRERTMGLGEVQGGEGGVDGVFPAVALSRCADFDGNEPPGAFSVNACAGGAPSGARGGTPESCTHQNAGDRRW